MNTDDTDLQIQTVLLSLFGPGNHWVSVMRFQIFVQCRHSARPQIYLAGL